MVENSNGGIALERPRRKEKWQMNSKMMRWTPWGERRGVSRPQMSWADDIKRIAELNWYKIAHKRE